MTRRLSRRGAARLWGASGAVLAVACAYTGASTVYSIDGQATIAAARDFDIMVAGVPGEAAESFAWVEGNPEAYQVGLGPADGGFGPGDERVFTLGVLNASQDLGGTVTVSVVDPDPADPGLFPFLEFTMMHGDEVVVDGVRGDDPAGLSDIDLGAFAAGESTSLRLVVRFTPDAGNEAQGLRTHVRVDARGEST